MTDLKAAWQRGEIVEYRERGAEGNWWLCPTEWDEARYEYREYHPLTAPPKELTPEQQRAVDLGKRQIEALRQRDQAALDAEVFTKPYEPRGKARVLWAVVFFVGFLLAALAAWSVLR